MAEAQGNEEPIDAQRDTLAHPVSTRVIISPPRGRSKSLLKRLAGSVALLVTLSAAAYVGYPTFMTALTTVSTDDAYVNSHVTYVAPRIPETVVEVKVDNDDYVKKGDLLIVLDDAMSKIKVGQAKAALDLAESEFKAQRATARATVASAKANRYKLMSAMTGLRDQVAGLRAAIAAYEQKKAAENLARLEAERYLTLAKNNSVTQEQADVRKTDHVQALEAARASLEQVKKIRAALEVDETPPSGRLDEVPDDLEQRHSSVLTALAALAHDMAQLGLELPAYYEAPRDYIEQIKRAAPNGDIDALIEKTVAGAPGVETARARVAQAQQDLAMTRLNLDYCRISAEIDGYVSNRSVNPGDRVATGQRLLAVRSLAEVWIDCNFKETQLDLIRIGQPVDLYVDSYPGKVFPARVTGFNPGTGSSLALLPPQNATGNFVKIVQRLPVRVELVGNIPRETPLFIGLSCAPYIKIYEKPEGPNAGQRLRGAFPRAK